MLGLLAFGGLVAVLKTQGVSWLGVVAIFFTFAVLFVGHLLVSQEQILYIPEPVRGMREPADNPEGMRSPKEKGMAYKDIWLKTQDGVKLHAWFLSCAENPEDICLELDMAEGDSEASDLGLEFASKGDLQKMSDKRLRIKAVVPGGLVSKWNAANPDKIVRKGDRIYELDGQGVEQFGTAASLYEAIQEKKSGKITLKVHADRAPTYLFCHENAGNIGLRLTNFQKMISELKINILAFDYRGYGSSEGQPSEDGLIEDALTAWRWLQTAAAAGVIDSQQLIVNGRSLGGAVAIGLAKALADAGEPLPGGIVLENTFASIASLVDAVFPFLAFDFIKKHLLRLRWDSIERIRDVQVPLLFLSSEQDEIIPAWHMEALRKAATKSKAVEFQLFKDGGHNDTWEKAGARYWKSQAKFIKLCQERTKAA